MSCTAPTFSWAYSCPALPLPTYPLVIFFFLKKHFFPFPFPFRFFLFSLQGKATSLTFGTQPQLFCTFFKILTFSSSPSSVWRYQISALFIFT